MSRPYYAKKKSRSPKVYTDPTIALDPSITQVWTDGACSGNPGPGGWGWVTPDGRHGNGGEAATTNQRMEIQAALEAVRALGERPLAVVTDSTYVANCFNNRWWKGWLQRGWKNATGQPVANQDLWVPLIDLVVFNGVPAGLPREPVDTGIRFLWVKGHAAFGLNPEADRLAVEGRDRAAASR